MDREMIRRHLDQAEDHVRKGAEAVRKQKLILAHLEKDGHDTAMARKLLNSFEAIEADHIADRARIRKELAQTEGEREDMADDKTKTGKSDRDRINVNEAYELRDWSKRLGVSEGELKAAVKKVGPMAQDVAKELRRSL